jgi:hypothetical protein
MRIKMLVAIRLILCLAAIVFCFTAVNGIEDWRLWAVGTAVMFVALQGIFAALWTIWGDEE